MNRTPEELMRGYVARTDAALNRALSPKALLAQGAPQSQIDAMRYSVFAGGKRLRACLLLTGAELTGADDRLADVFAAAVEMIHAYSLIHDDLPCMDNDDIRRGKPTSHKVFGEAGALLAGDGLLTHAALIMADQCVARPDAAAAMRDVLRAAGVTGMVAGQALDLSLGCGAPDVNTLMEMIGGKTAALITGALTAGALLGQPEPGVVEALRDYGQSFGFAFQIADDLLDVLGDSERTGKSSKIDERNGKNTYVSVFGIERARKDAENHAIKAVEAIERFGERAVLLRHIATRNASREL